MVRLLWLVLGGSLAATASGCGCERRAPVKAVNPRIELVLVDEGAAPPAGRVLEDGETLAFGTVKAAGGFHRVIAVVNEGDGPLHLEPPVLEKGAAFQLRELLAPCGSARVDPGVVDVGDCRTVTVALAPGALGDFTDTLVFQSDDPARGRMKIHLAARGASGTLEVCVSGVTAGSDSGQPLDRCSTVLERDLVVRFGMVTLGSGDVRRRARLTNRGEVDLTVASVSLDPTDPIDFSVAPAIRQMALSPGASAEVAIAFKPSDVGARLATVTVLADDPATAPVSIQLEAAGDGPKLCLVPAALDFGDVPLGQVSRARRLAIQNCGTRPLEIAAATVEGNPDFAFAGAAPVGRLDRGEVANADLLFQPASRGPRSAQLHLESSDPMRPSAFAPLAGNGVPPVECRLEASTVTLDFGGQALSTTVARSVFFHNAGSASCTVSRLGIDAAGTLARFALTSVQPPPIFVPAKAVWEVRVEYTPMDDKGPDLGLLEVESDDPNVSGGRHAVALKGTPVPHPVCKLEVRPPKTGLFFSRRTLNFGTIAVGDKKTLLATLENVGSAPCDVGRPATYNLLLVGENPFGFGTHSPPLPSRILPGATQNVEVVFQPKSAASFDSNIFGFTLPTSDGEPNECRFGGGAGCKDVALHGAGATLALDIIPSQLDFGLVPIGCSSRARTATLYNIGGLAVSLTGFDVDPPGSPFSLIGKPATPLSLAPGNSVPLSVQYRPRSAARDAALLVVSHGISSGSTTAQLRGEGTTERQHAEEFRQNTVPKTDVLWVIDNSGSMADKQDFLAVNARIFVDQANATQSDYQIAVTTTTWARTNPPHKADRTSGFPGQSIEAGGFFGDPKIIRRTDPNPAAELERNIRVGECCSDSAESGLEGAKAALTHPMISDPARPNGAFVRADAKLAIIVLSDERDQGGSQSVQYYVDLFQNLKGSRNTALFAWHSIVGDAKKGCSATINGETISAEAGDRYIEASQRTGGIVRSICSADWGRIAADIGLDAFAAKAQFFLSRSADPHKLVVTVDGAPRVGGVHYDFEASSNSVIFRAGSIPPPGATVRVEYDALCL